MSTFTTGETMLRKIAGLAFIYLALAFSFPVTAKCSAVVELMPPIQLEETLRGISIQKRPRFLIEDIRIGDTSVLGLFLNSDSDQVSTRDYYRLGKETISIRLREDRLLSRLKYIALTNEPAYLDVYLVDPRKSGALRRLREKASSFWGPGFSKQFRYPITINLPVCERVTQVIFYGIDAHLQHEVTKGQTEISVSLEHLFQLLRKDRLDSFMKKLGPIEKICPGAFRLFEWIRNEAVYGFEFKRYEVTPELGSVLDAIAKSLARFQRWQRYDFRILVVGYTDPVAVQDPGKSRFFLDSARTGVKSLASKPLAVYYRGCNGNRPVSGNLQYVDFFTPAGQLVRSPIETNCELGAVRAFAATAFLVERLGRKNIQYLYATGGISPTGSTEEFQRKVDLKIVVKAAKVTK